jgi:hypothetical protein
MESTPLLIGNRRGQLFVAVKYLVYLLLSLNVYLFMQEEMLALEHTFGSSYELGQFVQVFAATLDTAAWVILLLLFELETSVLDDKYIKGAVKWALHGTRGLCYVAIVYAFSGYCIELLMLYDLTAIGLVDACSMVGADYSLMQSLNEYVALDSSNCAGVVEEMFQLSDFNIIVDAQALQSTQWLGWTDVINAGNWILVCFVLEIEVRLQLRDRPYNERILAITKLVKPVLYTILFAAALYWGYAGNFLDFWDAALWLFAFIFIELNLFDWQNETSNTTSAPSPDPT